MGVSVKYEFLREECRKAKNTPTYENTFKRLYLNIITEQAERWLQLSAWDACIGDKNTEQLAEELEGQLCYVGLDLSRTTDLTALGLVFPPTDERPEWAVLVKAWSPKENAIQREKKDRVPYLTWARQGYLSLTEGNVVDYDFVLRDIVNLTSKYRFSRAKNSTKPQLGFDRWGATDLMIQGGKIGFDMVLYGQGMKSMSPPTKEFERIVLGGKIVHGGNPLLRWCLSNVAIESDPAGNIKPAKDKSTGRIDPVVAAIMGIGMTGLCEQAKPSVYETRGIRGAEDPVEEPSEPVEAQ